MKANLCTPCKEALCEFLEKHGHNLQQKTLIAADAREKDQKVTCLACGRKRFGGSYEFDGRLFRSFKRKHK